MARSRTVPVAPAEYRQLDEQSMRSALEHELEDMQSEISRNESKQSKPGTLAIRRFQFMFMGSGNV